MTGVRLSNNSFYQTSMDIMAGTVEPECLGDKWERSMDFHVYKAACTILDHPHQPGRAGLIAEYPPRIAEMIKVKMIAIHNIRLKQKRLLEWQEQQQRKRRLAGAHSRFAELTAATARHETRQAQQADADGWKDWV